MQNATFRENQVKGSFSQMNVNLQLFQNRMFKFLLNKSWLGDNTMVEIYDLTIIFSCFFPLNLMQALFFLGILPHRENGNLFS